MPGSTQIPVETILKVVLDKTNADTVRKFMADQEASYSRVEATVGRISDSVGEISRFGLGLAGIAGLKSVADNFMTTSQYGSNVGLAAGQVTGGASVWHNYSQSLLTAQSKTGVQASEIAQGLIQAVQAVGGNPTPGQAAILGGLLAGVGQTTGMTPSQVASVIAPLLQASNRALTAGNILGVAATMSSGLTAFPGSQAAPMEGLLAQLGVEQAIGSGPAGGYSTGLTGLTSIVNAAASANRIWRNPSLTGSAANSITGGLQNAYTNPSLEAFMTMAGISYQDQRKGLTKDNLQAVMSEATKLYGTGNTRDIFLRSIFGLQGADLLEQFSPGSKASKLLNQQTTGAGNGNTTLNQADVNKLKQQIHNAQAATTPNADVNKVGGTALGWFEKNPLTAVGGLLGLYGGSKLLKGGLTKGTRGLSKLLGKNASNLTDTESSTLDDLLDRVRSGKAITLAESDTLDSLASKAGLDLSKIGIKTGGGSALDGLAGDALGIAGGALTGGVLAFGAQMFLNDGGTDTSETTPHASAAFKEVLKQASKKKFRTSADAEKWMLSQVTGKHVDGQIQGPEDWSIATGWGSHISGATDVQQAIKQLFKGLGGNGDPIQTFYQAADKLLQYANKQTTGTGNGSSSNPTSYTPGSSTSSGVLAGTQAIGSEIPGMELTAFLTGGASSTASTGDLGGLFTTYEKGTVGGRKGRSLMSSAVTGSLKGAQGNPQMLAALKAAAKKYGVPVEALYGIYGHESTFGTNAGPGTANPKSYGYMGLTGGEKWSDTNYAEDANAAAETLAHDIKVKGNLNSGLLFYSGGGYGAASANAMAMQGGYRPGQSDRPIHVHVNVDGHKVTHSRILRGQYE